MGINLVDWFGYLASLVVLISLLSNSIIRLRWINLVGAAFFATYGFLINSIPTACMNLGIVAIDIYYLVKIYTSKENFQISEISLDSDYFKSFMSFHKNDIKKFFNYDHVNITEKTIGFYILRDAVPAGLFIGEPINSKQMKITMDFATPQYRDFKIGDYMYNKHPEFFIENGYKELVASSTNKEFTKYLIKMGFEQKGNEYIKKLG